MTQSSSDNLHESLSALVDNQASELEVRRIVKQAENNTELRDRWRRYHVASAVLKQEWDARGSVDLSERIFEALDKEEALSGSPALVETTHWRSRIGQLAIAASVAFVFVFGVQQFGSVTEVQPGVDDVATLDTRGVSAIDPAPSQGFDNLPLPPLGVQTVSSAGNQRLVEQTFVEQQKVNSARWLADPELQNHLNHLLIQHAEQAAASGGMGMLPFARVSRMEPLGE